MYTQSDKQTTNSKLTSTKRISLSRHFKCAPIDFLFHSVWLQCVFLSTAKHFMRTNRSAIFYQQLLLCVCVFFLLSDAIFIIFYLSCCFCCFGLIPTRKFKSYCRLIERHSCCFLSQCASQKKRVHFTFDKRAIEYSFVDMVFHYDYA